MTRPHRKPSRAARCLASALLVTAAFALAIPAVAGEVVHRGRWTAKGFDVDGEWRIEREGGRLFVVLGDDFRTKSAPDLKIFLSPRAPQELSSGNATQGSVRVGELRSAQGAQRLEVPAGTDLGRYRSIVLHCEQYTKLWAAAGLGG